MTKKTLLLGIGLLVSSGWARAADEAPPPLHSGLYVAPMLSYTNADSKRSAGNGIGGVLAIGNAWRSFSAEGSILYTRFGAKGGSSGGSIKGAGLDLLGFPFHSLGLFGIVGIGYDKNSVPQAGQGSFNSYQFEGGLGYLLPIHLWGYEFGVRADVRERFSARVEAPAQQQDLGATDFVDTVVNLGVQFPLGRPHPPAEQPEPPVKVVPLIDSDGDGVPDNLDQCPNTPPGTKVDEKGCPLPPLPPPPPECKSPAPGERVNLAGCRVGNTVVLHGVTFEFDQSRLTPDAKAILDQLADDLTVHPEFAIEVDGNTDGRGKDAYNQRLSEERAESVKQYLTGRGISPERMTAMGFGATRPVADNSTDEGREINRRVEIKITSAPGDAKETPRVAPPVTGAALGPGTQTATPASTSAPDSGADGSANRPAEAAPLQVPAPDKK